ncbi:MAG: polysaccharide deacetylase family protein [Parafilimonas sp.]|nr:polysaccharide deacetylase family protein [Parafilimonas sp.]
MLLIYTTDITNRIRYVMQYVFDERLGIEYSITNNKEAFISNTSVLKIVYGKENISEELFFYAEELLFENNIKKNVLNESAYNNLPVLFSHNKKAALQFDIFAAIFYLLSRYEEYLNEPLDKHKNYNYQNSILYKLKILDTPIIEQWMELLKDILLRKLPSLQFKKHTAKFGLSFDIDVAYAYKNRNAGRVIGGISKKMLQLDVNETKRQLLTLANKKEDIFDTYDYIFSTIKTKKPVFFFNMGLYGRFDKNPSSRNKKFRELIKNISEKAVVGLHPSYSSNRNKNFVSLEKNKLEKIIDKPVLMSRQHYLKLKFPDTYRNLINNNFIEDYTVGYSAVYGFRAGTCNSFLFFDLKKNETTNLRLFPFSYMDVTLNNYLQLSIEEAKKIVSNLISTIYKYEGIFIPLWHNSTLCDCNEWKDWRKVFEYTLKEIDNKNFENLFK